MSLNNIIIIHITREHDQQLWSSAFRRNINLCRTVNDRCCTCSSDIWQWAHKYMHESRLSSTRAAACSLQLNTGTTRITLKERHLLARQPRLQSRLCF